MNKLLRKYKQQIMVVGGSLLMVAFLMPSAIQQVGRVGLTSTVARFKGGKITAAELRDAQNELRILDQITPPRGNDQPGLIRSKLFLERGNPTEHWILLCHLAKQAGMMGGQADAIAFLEHLAQDEVNASQQIKREQRDQVAAAFESQLKQSRSAAINSGTSEMFVDRTLSKAAGVIRLRNELTRLAPSLSSAEAELGAINTFDTAICDIAFVPASAPDSADAKVDEQRLQDQFEKYKDVPAGTGEFGFGYQRLPAVQVEWLTIDRRGVGATVNADDLMELNRYWRANKSKYNADFAQARQQVEADYRAQEGGKIVDKAEDAVRKDIYRSTISVPSSKDTRFKEFPADWASKMPSLDQLASDAAAAMGVANADRLVHVFHSDGVFRDRFTLPMLAGIGAASGTVGDFANVSFSQSALGVRELDPSGQAVAQVDQVYGPLHDASATTDFYFRVLAARPLGPPDNLAEVRDRVMRDVGYLDSYHALESKKDEYVARLSQGGITGLASTLPGVHIETNVAISSKGMVPAAGGDSHAELTVPEANKEKVRQAVVDRISGWDAKTPVADIPVDQRRLAVIDPSIRGLVIVEITGRRPVYSDILPRLDPTLVELARRGANDVINSSITPEMRKLTSDQLLAEIDPLSMKRLSVRLNFEDLARREKSPDEADEAAPNPAASNTPAPDSKNQPAAEPKKAG